MATTDYTDWDQYYSRPYKTASVTRKISQRKIIAAVGRHLDPGSARRIAELGGANSCFYEGITEAFSPREYHIYDNNQFGIERFKERFPERREVVCHLEDILDMTDAEAAMDLVFSVGLIEHFDEARTRAAIRAHFQLARPGGLVLITFPTPTWLYRATRTLAERTGQWIFHDERPLGFEEVLSTVEKEGQVLESFINWPIVLTQGYVVARRDGQ